MKWNKSQRFLVDLANEPVNAFALDQVVLLEDGPDLTNVIKEICNPNAKSEARHVRIHARTGWDCVTTLVDVAGSKGGSGWIANATRALRALSGAAKRPIVLWLEEIRLMKLEQREDLVFMLENIAWHNGINLRVVMLVGKSRVWVGHEEIRNQAGEMVRTGKYIGKRKTMHCFSDKLDAFATEYKYDGKRIQESDEITPLFESHEHQKVQALAMKVS